MLSRLHAHVTFANVVSLLALFVALSGGAYALTIPRNSVGAKQLRANAVRASKIKRGAVTSRKVRNRSLLAEDFRPGQLPEGQQGPKGDTGAPGPLLNALPSGKTLRGAYAASGVAPTATPETVRDAQSFAFPLSGDRLSHVIPVAGPATAECPGTVNAPAAAPGHLCVYQGANANAALVVDSPGATGSGRFGWIAQITSTAAGTYQSRGTWAVTAP